MTSQEITPVNCYALSNKITNTTIAKHVCNDNSHSWCIWNDDYQSCLPNYDCSMFMNPTDSSSPSVVFYGILCGVLCYFVYYYIGTKLIRDKLGLLNHLELDRQEKCIIYITEIIFTSFTLFLFCYRNSISVVWDPKSFEIMTPSETKQHFALLYFGGLLITYVYILEMTTEGNKMRWPLKMHHITYLILLTLFIFSMNERSDVMIIRFAAIFILYAVTETNVFLQLLLYRLKPDKYLIFHNLSTVLYIVTRLLIITALIVAYIDFFKTDFVKNELFENISEY
eukprot:237317_1